VKRDQREMFLTLPTNEIRFQWLTRRYNDKYGREGWGGGHGYFQWLKIRCPYYEGYTALFSKKFIINAFI
jgi:hypothetical protein